MIRIIAGVSLNNVIGVKGSNELLWSSELDMIAFKQYTRGGIVVMGNDTYKAIGRPLVDRTNIVMSKSEKPGTRGGVTYYNEYKEVLKDHPCFWVIGGESIYNLFLPFADEVVLTTISLDITKEKNYARFPSTYVHDNFYLWKESKVVRDRDRKTNRPINLVFTRWKKIIERVN